MNKLHAASEVIAWYLPRLRSRPNAAPPDDLCSAHPCALMWAASGEPVLKDTTMGLEGLGFVCQFIASEPTLLWSKLCFLERFVLVTSASGKNLGEILADGKWKGRFESAIREACAGALKEGAEVDAEKGARAYAAYAPACAPQW